MSSESKAKSSKTNRTVLIFTVVLSIFVLIITITGLLVYLIDQSYNSGLSHSQQANMFGDDKLTTEEIEIIHKTEETDVAIIEEDFICTPLSCDPRCIAEWYDGNFTCEIGTNVGPVDLRQMRPTKANHKAKLLSSRKLTSVAGLTDIERMFRDELENLLIVRVAGTPGATQAREHIKNRLNTIGGVGGWTIEEDRFTDSTPYGDKEFVNVIATYNPKVARRLVLACHYDSKYYAPRRDGQVFIGATDSAVPCAMLLDLAYNLNTILKSSTNEMVTLQLIFFDGEEAFRSWTSTDSIYGSRHLAAKWQQQPYGSATELDRIDMFVLLDLIGVANPRFHNHFPAQTGRWFQHMQNIESRLKSGGLLQSHNSQYFTRGQTGRIEDDHIPFLQRGVRCLHLIDHPFPNVWHTMRDNKYALHKPTINNLNKMFQTFVIEYLHLRKSVRKRRRGTKRN